MVQRCITCRNVVKNGTGKIKWEQITEDPKCLPSNLDFNCIAYRNEEKKSHYFKEVENPKHRKHQAIQNRKLHIQPAMNEAEILGERGFGDLTWIIAATVRANGLQETIRTSC